MANHENRDNLFLRLGRWLYQLKIIGEENIPAQGACVVTMNHSARYLDGMTVSVIKRQRPDTIAFGAVGMPPSRAIGKRIRQRMFSQDGLEPTMLGAIKARGFSAGELLKALKLLQAGRAILVAAEGEVPWDGQLHAPLAPGAAWMALRAHAPVLPIVMIGGYDILPRWRNRPRLSGRMTIRVGRPFLIEDAPLSPVSDSDLAEASQQIYDKMATLIAQGHA